MRDRFFIALNALMWVHYGPPAYSRNRSIFNSCPFYIDKNGQAYYHFLSLERQPSFKAPDMKLHWSYIQPWVNYPFTQETEKYIQSLNVNDAIRRAIRLMFSSAWSICTDDLKLDQYNHVSFQTRGLIYSMFNEAQRPGVFEAVTKAARELPAICMKLGDESLAH